MTKKNLPAWAMKSNGHIEMGRFIKVWATSSNLVEVRAKFHWKTEAGLKSQRSTINRWLKKNANHIKPLKVLKGEADWRKQKAKDIAELLDAGLLERRPEKKPDVGSSTIDRTGLGDISGK
mgnify:CR=1 FL=1